MASESAALLIGLSGPSSSGKTTLARLLRDIWPKTFILHEDDFYWPDKDIPWRGDVQDWDCLEAIDLSKLQRALQYIKDHGVPPPDLESKEDKNSVGEVNCDQAIVQHWQQRARALAKEREMKPIALIDGFLLYAQEMKSVRDLLDVKIFLRTDYKTAKSRRESRSGYVTVEGFWEDPPGYVDKIVWPNYVKDHAFLFEDREVEGNFDNAACREVGVQPVPKAAEADMTACLQWACEVIDKAIRDQS